MNEEPRQFERLASIYKSFAIGLLNTLVIFVGLNILIFVVGLIYPPVMDITSSQEDYLVVHNSGLVNRDYDSLREVYKYLNPNEMFLLLLENSNRYQVCDDLLGFREKPFQGHYFRIHDAGFRVIGNREQDQQPWPPDQGSYNIFVFGGSTTFGVGELGAVTIPAWLQTQVRQTTGSAKIYVYNFGNAGYFSLQERLLFEDLIQQGYIPDMAIFIDGLNEVVHLKGELIANSHCIEEDDTTAKRWRHAITCDVDEFCLPITRLLTNVAGEPGAVEVGDSTDIPMPPPVDDFGANAGIVENWLSNMGLIEATAREHDVDVYFVMQPVPMYAYDLSYHLWVKEFSGFRVYQRARWVYQIWERLYDETDSDWTANVLNLSHLAEDNQEPIYVDRYHYTMFFNQEIAWEINRYITEQKGSDLAPSERPRHDVIFLDTPQRNATVSSTFELKGWAVDPDAPVGQGPGIDSISVIEGDNCDGRILAEAPLDIVRRGVPVHFGRDESFVTSGYEVTLEYMEPGEFTFTICALNTITQRFDVSLTRSVTIDDQIVDN